MGIQDAGLPDLPAWADAALVGAVLHRLRADLAGGMPLAEAVERARDTALAHRPAMPLPRLEEAAALAVRLATAGDRGARTGEGVATRV